MNRFSTYVVILLGIVVAAYTPLYLYAQTGGVLDQYLAQLKKNPDDHALREKIIRHALTMKPPPASPEAAKRHMARGAAAIKEAKGKEDFADAVKEFSAATLAAPWYADAYYNLAIAQDKAGQHAVAIQNLKLYLLAAPNARDAGAVKRFMFEMGYREEKSRRQTRNPEPEQAPSAAEERKPVQAANQPPDISGQWFTISPCGGQCSPSTPVEVRKIGDGVYDSRCWLPEPEFRQWQEWFGVMYAGAYFQYDSASQTFIRRERGQWSQTREVLKVAAPNHLLYERYWEWRSDGKPADPDFCEWRR